MLPNLNPPADAHHGNGEAQKPHAEVPGNAMSGEEHEEEEGAQRPAHDLEVAGVAAGLTDAGGSAAADWATDQSMGVEQCGHWRSEVLMVSWQLGQGKTSTVEERLSGPAMVCSCEVRDQG